MVPNTCYLLLSIVWLSLKWPHLHPEQVKLYIYDTERLAEVTHSMCEPYPITDGQFVELIPNWPNFKKSEKNGPKMQMNSFCQFLSLCCFVRHSCMCSKREKLKHSPSEEKLFLAPSAKVQKGRKKFTQNPNGSSLPVSSAVVLGNKCLHPEQKS